MAHSVIVLYEMMKKPDDDNGESSPFCLHFMTKTETGLRRPRCLGLYPSLDAVATPVGSQLVVRIQSFVEGNPTVYHFQLLIRQLPHTRKRR